ncbi:hypothetical protein BJX99DRAFT_185832 [Aspergillus californicus]
MMATYDGQQENGHNSRETSARRSTSPQNHHRRGYQACDPCRKRKVKCDLGSVDNPRPPPCVRCRRESKRCEFSSTRRKRKTSDVEPTVDDVLRRDKRMMIGDSASRTNASPSDRSSSYAQGEPHTFDAISQPQQKWLDKSPSNGHLPLPSASQQYTPNTSISTSTNHFSDVRNTRHPVYSVGERPPLSRFSLEGNQPMMNRTAVELLSPAISNSHDALHLLSEAAGRTEDLNRQSLENRYAATRQSASSFASPISSMTNAGTPRSAGGSFSRQHRSGTAHTGNYYQGSGLASGEPHPDTRDRTSSAGRPSDSGYLDAVKAWSRLRFVRAGWLSVEESMAYVAYYYEHLTPLSPIVIPDFSHPSTHRTLLTDEPVLAVTMLTAASRHMKPNGDGSHSRAFYIHDRLWSYLRGMIERLFWGQEKFGNGIGINKPRSFDLAPTASIGHKGNLRSLGTIEALLILTDWHPRNLHFPPGDDENSLLDLDANSQARFEKDLENDGDSTAHRVSGAPEGRVAFQTWLEPAWRSDRMSWMLLSTAQALAFELGVFDQKNDANASTESPAEQTRKRRLRRLILVYITQSSGRLGIPSMLPLPQWADDIQPTPLTGSKADEVDKMHDCWLGISKIMYQSNQLLFASNEQTSDLIRSGRYRDQIDRFQPFLREWRQSIDATELHPAMRHILMIEYEYTRLYVNSLALQAVVDRWTTMSSEEAQKTGSSSGTGSYNLLMELYRVNEPFIQEVVDASRKILTTVLEGLVPGDHLKHAPVRTCFRILSGMIFILKTFTLGAKEDDVRVSLDLQDRTVEALRTCVVDDVHLNHTIARLLELLTSNIRTRFLRFAPLDRSGDGEQERTSAPNSRAHSPRPREGPQNRRDGIQNHTWTTGHGHSTHSQNIGYADTQPPTTTMTSVNDPLAGIPSQPINSSNINVSFMPPPPSVYYNFYEPRATPPSGEMDGSQMPSHSMNENQNTNQNANPGVSDWFALPLDQFFNSSTAVVDQGLGGTGPMVGEFDMLEVLLNEQYDGSGEGLDSGGNLPSQFMQS